MDLNALKTLEKRVETLESKVIAKTPLDEINLDKVKPVIDSLREVDTVLLSTLSGRERMTTLLKKVNELEKILDPTYLETKCNADMKVEDVLESEADLKNLNDNIANLEKLEPSLNSEMKNLSISSDQLTKIMSELSKIRKECNEQSTEFQRIVKEYQESMMYISKLFIELETCITQLEIESQPEKKK